MTPLRVAVVGAGAMGASHVEALSRRVSGARVTVVADPDASRAAAVAATAGARAETDAPAAITAGDVDAVVLASPATAHAEQVFACLAAGRPVLCEKPMTPDEPSARAVVEAEDRTGRRLVQVGFMRRYDAECRRLRALLASGGLGRPLMAHCVHRNVSVPAWWETRTALTESVMHEIDQVRYLFGEEIVAVTVRPAGTPTAAAPPGVSDPLLVLFETESGALVDVESFVRTGVGYEVRCEVVGERGTATIGRDGGPFVRRDGRWGGELPPDFVERFEAAYDAELRAFVAAAARGTVADDGASARDGHTAVVVCAAAVEALGTGRRTGVVLDPDRDPVNQARIRSRPEPLAVGMALAAAGGYLDAYTYVGHGGVFANAQTGNVVLIGVELARGDGAAALRHVPSLLAFLVGLGLAEVLARPWARRVLRRPARVVLVAEIVVLVACGALSGLVPDQVVTVAVSLVAALQVSTFRSVGAGGVGYNTTMATGNLRNLVSALARRADGDAGAGREVRALAGILLGFAAGAAVGALLTAAWGGPAVWVVAVVLAVVLAAITVETVRRERRRARRTPDAHR